MMSGTHFLMPFCKLRFFFCYRVSAVFMSCASCSIESHWIILACEGCSQAQSSVNWTELRAGLWSIFRGACTTRGNGEGSSDTKTSQPICRCLQEVILQLEIVGGFRKDFTKWCRNCVPVQGVPESCEESSELREILCIEAQICHKLSEGSWAWKAGCSRMATAGALFVDGLWQLFIIIVIYNYDWWICWFVGLSSRIFRSGTSCFSLRLWIRRWFLLNSAKRKDPGRSQLGQVQGSLQAQPLESIIRNRLNLVQLLATDDICKSLKHGSHIQTFKSLTACKRLNNVGS